MACYPRGQHLLPSWHSVSITLGDGTSHLEEDFALSGAKAESTLWMLNRKTDLIFLDNLSSTVWLCLKGREQLLMSTGRERKQSSLHWSSNPAAAAVLSGEISWRGASPAKKLCFLPKLFFERPQMASF